MMLIAAIIIVAWLAVFCYCVGQLMQYDKWWPLVFWLVLTLWAGLSAHRSEEDKGPCLRYESSMYYNAGSKTMQPIRKCVDRAEWVKEG